jgi:esterase/lipase
MLEPMTGAEASVSCGDKNAKRAILWIHGYTGSASAFRNTAERLARELDAYIEIPLLPGHGTKESDLVGHSFDDLVRAVRPVAEKLRGEYESFGIVGYSFGSYISGIIAREVGADVLIFALTPFIPRLFFRIPGVVRFLTLRNFWSKFLTREDRRVRAGTFYYPHLPGMSLSLISRGNSELASRLPDLACPILVIHNSDDPLVAPESGSAMLAQSGKNPANKAHVLSGGRHALFFTPEHDLEELILIDFLKKNLP